MGLDTDKFETPRGEGVTNISRSSENQLSKAVSARGILHGGARLEGVTVAGFHIPTSRAACVTPVVQHLGVNRFFLSVALSFHMSCFLEKWATPNRSRDRRCSLRWVNRFQQVFLCFFVSDVTFWVKNFFFLGFSRDADVDYIGLDCAIIFLLIKHRWAAL